MNRRSTYGLRAWGGTKILQEILQVVRHDNFSKFQIKIIRYHSVDSIDQEPADQDTSCR